MKVTIGVSNRHVHLKEEHLYELFGDDYKLEKRNDLTQPGQFASTALVSLKTSKGILENVRVLGPLRNYTQVEISKTDAYKLGVNPPDIHILPEQIRQYKLEGKETVSVRVGGEKGGILENVYLKVSEESFFELHLDTDDANAHLIKNGDIAEIIG